MQNVSRRQFVLGLGAAALNMGMVAPEAVAGSSLVYMLGDTKVTLSIYTGGSGRFVFFAPHNNETDGVAAAKQTIRKYGGQLLRLTHEGGGRNIPFTLGGKKFAIDPNRMFSNKGAKASLKSLGGFSTEALAAVRALAEQVAARIFSSRLPVVGVHNNTDGGDLSVVAYQHGHAAEAAQVYVNPEHDADDFFFVTKSYFFEGLKDKGFNVVLQKSGIADDGSFSVRCQRNSWPYANIEAQEGHQAQQKKMFEALMSL